MALVFDRNRGDQADQFLGQEWLETNGIRGYACGTVPDLPTRKYHGLLVVDVPSCGGRHVMLSAIQATAEIGGQEFDLTAFQYPGVIHPDGLENLEEMSCDMSPAWRYRCGSAVIERRLMMIQGSNTILVQFTLSGGPPVRLRLQPLISGRSHHALTRCNGDLDRNIQRAEGGEILFQPYASLPAVCMGVSDNKATFEPGGFWNYNVQYDIERRRGFPASEDLFCPGVFVCQLRSAKPVIFRASVDGPDGASLLKQWQAETTRRANVLKPFSEKFPKKETLALLHARAGEMLVVNSRDEASIIAGYPWFDEWGRDTMIALPGLTVYRGRQAEAMAILKSYAAYAKTGLIPNILGSGPEAGDAFNSVDASLWFFRAVQEYEQVAGDRPGVIAELLQTMEHLVRHFLNGDAENVKIRPDGLFEVAPAGASYTWMDACVDGHAVTPRDGLAVDLNALWYNALCYVAELCEVRDGKPAEDLLAAAQRAQAAFNPTFWVKEGDYLADVVRGGVQDRSVRPNQLVAVAVAHSPITRNRMHGVVERVRRELVTPYGLRTLSPADPKYIGRYQGTPHERDSAYHQGTVWPWLIGLYADACLKSAGDTLEVRTYLRELFRPLYTTHLLDGGLFSVSEIFDGDPPRHPRGCFAQAWSVAELIRVMARTE